MFANSMSINETVKNLLNVYKITVKLTALSCYFSLFKTPVWIFPSHLMIRNFSPSTAVPSGISVTLGTTAFPFSVPLDGRHFTKEEVKRATLARQLHHFLGHPNDQFLKSTLDRGLFSHHMTSIWWQGSLTPASPVPSARSTTPTSMSPASRLPPRRLANASSSTCSSLPHHLSVVTPRHS